jgi:trk system potassium uptake protein TrkH
MNLRIVGFSCGLLLIGLSIFMLIPAYMDFSTGNAYNGIAFLECAIGGFFIGSLLALTNRGFTKNIGIRESLVLTTATWLIACFYSSLPLHFSDLHLSFTDAFFEGTSGLTTTGGTVLTKLEHMSPGILIWRSLIMFIGGMGMITLGLIFLPFLRIGGMQLFQSESSDRSEKIMPRTASVIRSIFVCYCLLALACALLYSLFGMNAFDAINHAMSTVATGGYGTYDSSFMNFNPAIQWTTTLFMFLGGLPFVLYVQFVYKKNLSLFRDSQVRAFFLICCIPSLLIALWVAGKTGMPMADAMRHSFFNVVSVLTTTGFSSTDYMQWGSFPIVFFLFLTYLGSCTGSTAGGIKTMRLQIIGLHGMVLLKKMIYPHGTFTISYKGQPLSPAIVQSVMVFLFIYVAANILLTLLLTLCGLDFVTAVSGAATAIANVGPGIGDIIGPAGNFSSLPDAAKILLSFGMILGRLELMTVLVLFHPSFWRH